MQLSSGEYKLYIKEVRTLQYINSESNRQLIILIQIDAIQVGNQLEQ